MKKMLATLLSGAMVLSLAACGNNDSGGAASTPGSSSAGSSSPSTESVEDVKTPTGPVTLNVTTTFAGEDTNAANYQEAIAAWQKETGNKLSDASGSSTETL